MPARLFTLICLSFLLSTATKGQSLSYYLPDSVTYNPEIPKPESIIGFPVGEWHVSHDRLVWYMGALAAASDRIQLDTIGFTHEKRPLLLLTISRPENLTHATSIKQIRQQVSQGTTTYTKDAPSVVYMGYSIHGNEASGSNAALLTAYFLAAAESPGMDMLLKHTIILLDPSLNPDGLQRFSNWVNAHKGNTPVSDPLSREFSEAWPSGRTNHYWFDLNRDWLPARQPESQARLAQFHDWKPNVLTDHHEMWSNSTFFFQPGIPSRNHPLTPANNYVLTEAIAQYHAAALDSVGSLYYSKESFDDFFYGKGSTYPDINGAVGILFEQASSRGLLQENDFGALSFPFAIRNQFITSLSTLQAAAALRPDLLQHQQGFYRESLAEGQKDSNTYYLFSTGQDAARAAQLAQLFQQHQIIIKQATEDIQLHGKLYPAQSSYLIPANQPQHRLLMAMTEKRRSFQDSLFYDVSAWALPLAFNASWDSIAGKEAAKISLKSIAKPVTKGELLGNPAKAYAYIIDWQSSESPAALYTLLSKGIRVRVSHQPFKTTNKQFSRGSLLIPIQTQPMEEKALARLMQSLCAQWAIHVYALESGNTQGIMLGSPQFEAVQKPFLAIVVEEGVDAYAAGELWHLFDKQLHIPVTLLPLHSFSSTDLNRYTTLLMPDGNYSGMELDKLKNWIQNGGTLIALQEAARWLALQGITRLKFKTPDKATDSLSQKPYASLKPSRGALQTGGAIFQTSLDLSHPIAYGYEENLLPIFRNNNIFLEPALGGYANPLRYTANPLLSGYVAKTNLDNISNSAAVQISSLGKGRIISFTDNPVFRGFWFGTNRLLINGVFFGNLIDGKGTY